MSNMEIILSELVLRGIDEEVDTYQGWKRKGKQVQKGSKALFQTKIWKPCKVKSEDGDEERMYMVNASFFGASQVA